LARPPRTSPLGPSPTLCRSCSEGKRHRGALRSCGGLRQTGFGACDSAASQENHEDRGTGCTSKLLQGVHASRAVAVEIIWQRAQDRKSTRLNSSHASISYAL